LVAAARRSGEGSSNGEQRVGGHPTHGVRSECVPWGSVKNRVRIRWATERRFGGGSHPLPSRQPKTNGETESEAKTGAPWVGGQERKGGRGHLLWREKNITASAKGNGQNWDGWVATCKKKDEPVSDQVGNGIRGLPPGY